MFLKFQTQEERSTFGGSDFVEIQYCTLTAGTPDEKIISTRAIEYWKLTSLYIYDEEINDFYIAYKDLLPSALRNIQQEGELGLYSNNYYNAEKTKEIKERLKLRRPQGFEVFLQWLNENPYDNGFYILGL